MRLRLRFLRLRSSYWNVWIKSQCTSHPPDLHHKRKLRLSLYVCVVISPSHSRQQTDPHQGHWLVIGRRCLWLKFIFYTPPSHLHSHRTGLQLQPAWDRAGGVSVLWRVGRVNTAHTSVHVWTHVNTYAYTRILTTHMQSPCASPPLPCSSWVKPGPRHFTSGCLQGSEVMCNGPVHLPEQ